MEDKIKTILDFLKEEKVKVKQEILLKCAVKIGTPEWAEEVNSLWKRMENLDKEKNKNKL